MDDEHPRVWERPAWPLAESVLSWRRREQPNKPHYGSMILLQPSCLWLGVQADLRRLLTWWSRLLGWEDIYISRRGYTLRKQIQYYSATANALRLEVSANPSSLRGNVAQSALIENFVGT